MNDTLDHDLEQRLRDLAAGVQPPEVPVEQDVGRGRRRLRRIRSLMIAGSVLAVVAVSLGGYLATGAVSSRPDVAPAGTPTPSPDPTHGSTEPPRPSTSAEPGDFRRDLRTMQPLLDVVAEHLDPEGDNLPSQPSNIGYGDGLGTKLGWREPGESGLGMVQIYVGPGWTGFIRTSCHYRDCRHRTIDGIETTVIEYMGMTSFVVRNPDTDITIGASPLFTFDRGPVESMSITLEQLVRAAGDARLVVAAMER